MSTDPNAKRWLQPMRPRDPEEIHHGLAHGHNWDSLLSYGMVFFAIWWAWMNFTWFASAYDVDDTPYRVGVFVQMTGVLVLAAGVPRVIEHQDFGVIRWVL